MDRTIRDLQSELDYGVSPTREQAIVEWVESKGFALVEGKIVTP